MLDRADSPTSEAFRRPRRRRCRPGRGRKIHRKARPKPPFSPARRSARLDAIVLENPPWAGVFRRRLALSAAAANARRAGRTEDEAALRDAFHLTRPGADPGPAGRSLIAWRELISRSAGQWRPSVEAAAEVLRVPHDDTLQEAVDAAEAGAGDKRPAPFAAAQVFAFARRALTQGAGRQSLDGRGGEGELLAAWLADAVLARRLKWPFALPLLAAPLFAGAGRRPGDVADGAEGAIVFAYARARRAPATFRRTSAGGRKCCWRPSRNCAPRGLRPR